MSNLLQAHRQLVGSRIREARMGAHLSHDALGAAVGTSRQHLIKLERGQHLPRPEMLAKIAEATGKPEAWFESDDDEESSLDFGATLQRLFAREVARAVANLVPQVRT